MSAFRNNIRQEVYSYKNDKRQLVRKIENFHHADNRIGKKVNGFVMHSDAYFNGADKHTFIYYCSMTERNLQTTFIPYNYSVDCNWVHLDSTRVSDYYEDGKVRVEKTLYCYDSPIHLQPTKTTQIVGGDTVVTELKYSSDMQGDIYAKMVDMNMLLYPVEGRISSVNGGHEKLIKGKYNDYSFEYGNLVLSRVSKILQNGNKERLYDYKYNEYGRLIEFTDKDELKTSIIWDKRQMYPLYVANGIDYTSLKKAYDGGTMNGSSVGSAQMTSYTYTPLVGMTSKKQPNGFVTRYEYDPLGRLTETYMEKPDGKSQLLQKIDYKVIKSKSFMK